MRGYGNFQLRDDPEPMVHAMARGDIRPRGAIEPVIAHYPPMQAGGRRPVRSETVYSPTTLTPKSGHDYR